MVDNIVRQTSKKTWYKWSVYINIILFFIVALFIYLLVRDCILYGMLDGTGDTGLLVARDIAFIAIAMALIFFQFFKNIFTIMKRAL
jgi:hypothetical protein